MTQATLLFLGTGASMGTPVVTCKCRVCVSKSPFNHRLRPSALITVREKRFLIDPGPDFRQQALQYGIDDLDGVLITHTHFDHIAGLDDLRVFDFLRQKTIPCLLSKESMQEIQRLFFYFKEGTRFRYQVIENDFSSGDFEGLKWKTVSFVQSGMKVTGFQIGDLAYLLDIKQYTDRIFEELKGVQTLVLSALRQTASKAHLSIDEAIVFAQKMGAKMTWLSHVAHEIDHEEINHQLSRNIQLAYDGLELTFQA
jgi:phosphoribosyl 1,2-cyclic phosphate phosphodiesterase